jgi:phosphonate transport system substrate-binding protein
VVNNNQALIDHLHNSLQLDINPVVASDYNDVIEALRAKKLDVAFLGPFSCVLAILAMVMGADYLSSRLRARILAP